MDNNPPILVIPFSLFILAILPQAESLAHADRAIKAAFANLYALPSDTAAAPMGSWVMDSAATTREPDQSGVWRIVVTKLTDTGRDLDLRQLAGAPGTSPAELAEAAAAVQRLEGKISKAEAEASLEITVTVHPADTPNPTVAGPKTTPSIPRAQTTLRIGGHWVTTTDRELGAVSELWSPATLHVRFSNVAVTARGSDEMVDRVIKETRWEALAALR